MPDSEREAELLDAERRLQAAQRAGDVAAFDDLLHENLVAVGPDGTIFGKQDDLRAHRERTSVVDELVEEELRLVVEGGTGVTFFVGRVSGTFDGSPVTTRLRYTRTWVYGERGWQILAAHISPA
ncbi:nuclear transport factor 2 family protein [Micromonospora okii]|uniref:nuclear transport factor 2 family protein n=1 Tax=Micromonospora okii TaxID=1182970 RepID=UPI001E4FBD89|nr:nuclear transport factor 2 family protein [Micromonospora okii]